MARITGTIAALAAALLLALALTVGCGKHRRAVGPEALPVVGADEHSSTGTAALERKLIAEFHRLYPEAEKRPAELMDADATVVSDLTAELLTEDEQGQPLDPPRVRLSFTATNFADYNNDAVVNIADITPIAQRFGTQYDDAPPVEELLSERTVLGHPDTRHNRLVAGADGGGNGKVDISDITPLAVNFNAELSGYNLYRAEVVDSLLTFSPVPLANLLGGESQLSVSLVEWSAQQELASGLSAATAGRFVITLETEAPPPGEVYGYRAHAWGDGDEGPQGNVATVTTPSEEDTVPPYWLDTVGVTSTLALDEGVEVRWGAAYDAKSPPVHYRLYYSPGTTLDWGSATVVDDVTSPYQVYGLTTLEPYTFAVRAYDSADPPNMELNTHTRTDYAGPRDVYPPEWSYGEGCQAVVAAEDRFYVTWPRAIDYHDEDGTIYESGPVQYTVYYSTEYPLDLETAEKVVVEDYDMPALYTEITDILPDVRYYFLVRATDSAIIPNEDTNTVVCSGKTHVVESSTVVSNTEEFEYRYAQIFLEPDGITGFYLLVDDSGTSSPGVALRTFSWDGSAWTDELLFEPTGGRSISGFSVAEGADGKYHLAVRAENVFSSPILYYLTWDGQQLTTVTRENGRFFCGISLALRDDGVVGFAYTNPGTFPDSSTYTYYMEYENGEWSEELVFTGERSLFTTGDSLAYDASGEPMIFVFSTSSPPSRIWGKQGEDWQLIVSDDDIAPNRLAFGTLVQTSSSVYMAVVDGVTYATRIMEVSSDGGFTEEHEVPYTLSKHVARSFVVSALERIVGVGSMYLRGPGTTRTIRLGSVLSDGWVDLVYVGESEDSLSPGGIRNPVLGGDGSLYYSYMQDRRPIGEDSILLKVDRILP